MTCAAHKQSFAGDRRGAAAIEFAIVAPVLFAMLFGVFEIGRLMYEQSKAAAAASAGARAAAIYGADDDDSIEAAIEARYSAADINKLDITISDETFGAQAFRRIDVVYDFDFLIHFSDAWSGVTITETRYAPDFS